MATVKGAIGVLETRGFVGMVEAVDTMLKASNVNVLGQVRVGAGLVSIIIHGDIGAVRVATDAGAEAAKKGGGSDVRATIIANPTQGLFALLTGEESK
jgi:ethanolamine utilization protein EutM